MLSVRPQAPTNLGSTSEWGQVNSSTEASEASGHLIAEKKPALSAFSETTQGAGMPPPTHILL